MTSKQRVLAAMRREQPDRMPIHMRGVRAWDSEWVGTRDRSYRPLIEAVLEHCDLIPVAGMDGVHSPLLTTATNEISETRVVDAGDWEIHRTTLHTPKGDVHQDYWESKTRDLPMVRKYFIETPEDAERMLSVPYAAPKIDLSHYLELREKWPDNLTILMCPQAGELVHDLLGTETFAYFWAEHRDLLYRLREAFIARVLDVIDAVLAAGAGPVLGTNGVEQVAPPIHSPQTYREFVVPTFTELCERVHAKGCLLHVHCHNKLNANLEDIAGVGWDCTHPVEPAPMGDVDLADAKRRVGKQMCLEGNIQIGEIYASPTERVTRLVEDAISAGKPGGGFILCPTASPYTETLSHLTVGNYLAMIEAGVRLGGC
jgi:hypothetical protein